MMVDKEESENAFLVPRVLSVIGVGCRLQLDGVTVGY